MERKGGGGYHARARAVRACARAHACVALHESIGVFMCMGARAPEEGDQGRICSEAVCHFGAFANKGHCVKGTQRGYLWREQDR